MSPRRRLRALRALSRLLAGSAVTAAELTTEGLLDVVDLARRERLAAMLDLALERADLHRLLPPAEAAASRAARRRVAVSTIRFQHQLATVLGVLNAAGIDAVVLKGGALLADGNPLAPQTALSRCREMYDLDILVALEDYERASSVLLERGYQRKPLWTFEPAHAITFSRDDDIGTIDLHAGFGTGSEALLPVAEVFSRALTRNVLDVPARVLSPVDALAHDIWHSEVADLNYRIGGLPLRQLCWFALAYRQTAQEDWRQVCRRFEAAGLGSELAAHCELARRLLHLDIAEPPRTAAAHRHLIRARALFAIGRVPDVHRNLIRAFDADYLRTEYGDGRLSIQRVRHAARLVRRSRRAVVPGLLDASVR